VRLFLKGDVLYFFTRGRAKLKSKERPRPAAATIPGLGTVRAAWLPVLITYFAYGASTITQIALLYLQKETLALTPAEVAHVAFWANLPWSMKMVVGAASDAFPVAGNRRRPYLIAGALLSVAGYLALATIVTSKGTYLAATVAIAIGFMVQDVIADALSVEVAANDEEMAQVQTLGRMSLLGGTVAVGYLSGVLAGALGPRPVFAIATVLPALVLVSAFFVRSVRPDAPRKQPSIGRTSTVMGVGLGYGLLGIVLEVFEIPFAQEIVLVVSGILIILLLRTVGITRAVAIAAGTIFLFRAAPDVGQGYSYWAIDRLGFDQQFLGILAQVGAVLGLLSLVFLRDRIIHAPVSRIFTWIIIAGAVLLLPNIGLFYGLHEWLGVSARAIAVIDTTITAPLVQLAMVPMLILIARTAPAGNEATMFAIMASLMNLALSSRDLFTRYLNEYYRVTQEDYSNLGLLMTTVCVLNLVPLIAIPFLRRAEAALPHKTASQSEAQEKPAMAADGTMNRAR
jgi:hypothetical protein